MRPEVSPDFQDYKYYTYYYSYGEQEKQRKRRERIKGFSFLRRKGDSQRKEEEKISIGEEGERLPKKRARKLNRGRLALMLVAMAFLAAGILWQNGIIDPFKLLDLETPVKKDEIKPAVREGPSKKAIQREPKRVSTKPKRTVSRETGGPQVKTPIRKPPPVKKQLADIKTPVVKKGTTDTPVPRKTETVSTMPEVPVLVEKPSPLHVISIPESPSVGKDVAITKTPLSPEKIVSYPYSLYLGSFRTLERAKKVVSFYDRNGLSPYWVKVLLSKGKWFRVYTGYFEDSEKAEEFRKENGLEEATVEETPYANLIGVFSSSDELEEKIRSLKSLGYCPYVIKDHNGKSRLLVGAFYPEYRAERQYGDLKSSGIESKIVKR